LNLVNRIRILRRRISAADRDYSSLIRDANDNVPPITRETIFLNTAFGTYVKSKSSPELIVLGAFTKQGWDLYVRDRLGRDRAKQLAIERWVLGENEGKSIQETEKQLNELRDRYFNNYIRAWGDFMKDFDVRIPQSNDEALDELNALSEVPWPYQRLLKILDENTRLDESTEEQLERQVKFDAETKLRRESPTVRYLMEAGVIDAPQRPNRWESPPERAFKPMVKFGVVPGQQDPNRPPPATSLGHYQERLVAKLVSVLTDLRDSKNMGVDPKTVRKEFETAIRGTNELLNPSQDGFTRPILSPLLLNPLQAAYGGTQADLLGRDGASWEAEVWSKWHTKLMDGYPFTDTWRDVKLTDYSDFFRPETGLLFGYYKAHLVDTLEQQGSKFIPTTRFTKTSNYTGDFLKCYERGYEISRATFEKNGEAPQVDFQINLHSVSDNVSEVTFDIMGASHTYKNEPEEWLDVSWPPKDPKSLESRIKIHGWSALDEEIKRPGDWGFFRLLDAATKIEPGTEGGRRGGAPTIVVTWTLRSQRGQVKMDIKASKEDNAFVSYIERKKRIFTPYNCPRIIALGVR
jgi:type VI secretion system protein ImpL